MTSKISVPNTRLRIIIIPIINSSLEVPQLPPSITAVVPEELVKTQRKEPEVHTEVVDLEDSHLVALAPTAVRRADTVRNHLQQDLPVTILPRRHRDNLNRDQRVLPRHQ